MTPDTVHYIAQEIRYFRALLSKEEEWAQLQPESDMRANIFRRIRFWRAVLKFGEERLSQVST